jgi:predicted methyltransferase
MKKLAATWLTSLLLTLTWGPIQAHAETVLSSIESSAIADHRSAKNITRNQFRHPAETLTFFGLKSNMTVVEIWPGGGWYSEILAPVLKENGQYYAAGFSLVADRTPDWRKNYQRKIEAKL